MRCLSILGSTGSIGRNTLRVVDMFPERFSVKALAAKNNITLLSEQIVRFKPDLAVVYGKTEAAALKKRLPVGLKTEILHGPEGYHAAAVHEEADTVVSAMVGAAGLLPTLAAIAAGKHIALANKETLVMAGDLVMAQAKQCRVSVLPVDSEHSAIFQCLAGNRARDLKKILLTASGGPFRNRLHENFAAITPEDALSHPTWDMGKKITIDSATLMNKGLEVIEAKHLFAVDHHQIEVVVHPQSIIHSMVAYRDGSVIAQLGAPDMRGAIACALSWPERLPLDLPVPDFAEIGSLTFEKPDMEKFPCLALAYRACDTGGTLPCVLNAANEVAVDAFLNKWISFLQIPETIEYTINAHNVVQNPDIAAIMKADEWARLTAGDWIEKAAHKGGI
ncbi:MAG: 1-deoxy-D-xylulose-5-phosphate reductoisomerase [Desulfobacteraceae bacterium]|nr:MAG: 1-deoxy-D-xylulose-5-phosphate reductoisomerase [Desulfobacteraceae bacterium]